MTPQGRSGAQGTDSGGRGRRSGRALDPAQPESLGYEVAGPVASAEEAVAEARRFRPDLVLMDIVLDGRPEGIDAAARIRADPLRGFQLQTYLPDGETLRAADGITAVQSPGDGSIRLQGSLRELLDRIKS